MRTHDTTETARAGFFAVGSDTFHRACSLGINPACALLVLARGTGADNMTTSWSAKSVRERIAVRSSTAVEAIAVLCQAGIAKKSGTVARPKYKLQKQGDLIWLPNAVVDGAGSERPPVARIRETQDPLLLRMFCDLYLDQNLAEDGGINPQTVVTHYSRRRLGQQGSWVVWGFKSKQLSGHWNAVTLPHRIDSVSDEQRENGIHDGTNLWKRLETLQRFGLFTWVPYLFDGPEGEPVFPVVTESGIIHEQAVADACSTAAAQMLTQAQWDIAEERGELVVPVRQHMEQATLFGIARLHYRPRTKMTSAWWADHQQRCEAVVHDLLPYLGGVRHEAA